MNYRNSKLRAIVVALIAAFALMACGAATTTTPTAPQASAQPTAAATSGASSAPQAINGSTSGAVPTSSAQAATTAPTTGTDVAAASAKLNLNEVTEQQLFSTIPNFPNRMVREFFEYRPYVSIQQFRKEIGKYVSADQVAAYEQYVYVPVDVNAADAATLQQLPGVDTAATEALIAGRPYASNAAFLAKLAEQVPNADAKQIEACLIAQ